MDSGLLYRVYRIQGLGHITHSWSYNSWSVLHLPLMKSFRCRFLSSYESYKVETLYTHEQLADILCILQSGPRANTLGVSSLDRFYNLPYMNFFVALSPRTVRITKGDKVQVHTLKVGWCIVSTGISSYGPELMELNHVMDFKLPRYEKKIVHWKVSELLWYLNGV